jgi:hypothetical protein
MRSSSTVILVTRFCSHSVTSHEMRADVSSPNLSSPVSSFVSRFAKVQTKLTGCGHGYGHHKRVLNILAQIMQRLPARYCPTLGLEEGECGLHS